MTAQTKQAEALKLFNEEKYAEAAEIYSSIIENVTISRDISVNYYYGVCLYYLASDREEAIKRLKFSSTRPVSPDVFYYLGKLYQQVYEMELAVDQFNRFLKLNKTESPKIEDAKKTIDDCNSAIRLINKYFNIEVLRKDTVSKNDILSYIKLSKDAGTLMLSQSFFVSGVESNQFIFRTERGNEVLFPMKEDNDSWDLYRIIKLLDSWSDPEELGAAVNSNYDELYPFLSIDGVTLYFSSNRLGGMGGFDIYQSYYDPETGTFSEPVNLGPPFNSPYDDYLLVTDEYEEKAWFVTNRGVENDKNIVVEIVWDDKVIKNNTENINQLLQLAALPLAEKSSMQTPETQSQKNVTQPKTDKSINFIINDTLIYQNVEQFWSEDALEAFNMGYGKEQEKKALLLQLDKKRKEYSQSYDRNEQSRLSTEILSLEQQSYSLENEVNRKYLSARRLELETINQLKSEGKYYSKTSIKQPSKEVGYNELKINFDLSKFSFYTEEDYAAEMSRNDNFYTKYFNKEQIILLKNADSLYFWGNVLNLESSKILEHTQKSSGASYILENSEISEMSAVQLINLSREMRQQSFELYEQSLDKKFKIYYSTLKNNTSTENHPVIKENMNIAGSYYIKAEENKNVMTLYNPETIQNMLSLKKISVEKLEETIKLEVTETTVTSEKQADIISEESISSSFNQNLEYKIQIGSFKNQPDPKALDKIPEVTKTITLENGLTKYFSGTWAKYSEAASFVNKIREAGFPGAFVVPFLNGEQIPVEKAKEIEEIIF